MNLLLTLTVVMVVFTYVGYPAWLRLYARLAEQPWQQGEVTADVTVVIAVHNEAERIEQRLDNLLAQEYDGGGMRVIMVSDGSTDDTVARVNQWCQRHGEALPVTLLEQASCCGKPSALNRAMVEVSSPLVVFADARQTFEPDTVARLVENFADPSVGACSGELCFRSSQGGDITNAAGLYWRIEKLIRRCQAMTGSVMGVTGAVYALRTALFRPLPEHILVDDLATPLNVMAANRRVVFDDRAIAWDEPPSEGAAETRRKIRTLAGVWQCLPVAWSALWPARAGLLLRFFSHKLLRLLVPWLLLLLLLGSSLSASPFWQGLAVLQWAGYLLVLIAWKWPAVRALPLVSTGYFFVLLNAAAAVSLVRILQGRSDALWKKPKG